MLDLQGYERYILLGPDSEPALGGMALTVVLALVSLLLAFALGALGALAKLSGSRIAAGIATFYTTLIRGVPNLVWLFLIFFGGQFALNAIGDRLGWDYIDVSAFAAGVVSLGLIYGAYMTETLRGAILAVDRGEIEAGHAYGMTPLQVFRRVTLPACVRHALPGIGNNWLVLVKDTALVSVIGLKDMVFNAAQAGNTLREPFTFYFAVLLLFLLITALSDLVLRWLNRRYSVGVRRV